MRESDRRIPKVWITKYALTQGITEATDVRVCSDVNENMIDAGRSRYFHKPDWHETREAAVERAEKMRLARIKAHERAVEKLREVKFS